MDPKIDDRQSDQTQDDRKENRVLKDLISKMAQIDRDTERPENDKHGPAQQHRAKNQEIP